MIQKILSYDTPRSIALSMLLLCIFAGLALAPFLFPGVRTVDTAARICIFIVLVASYDLLLGYGGIVSFAHTMFFGVGAYSVALTSLHLGRGFDALILGAAIGAVLATCLAAAIGLFSLRVRAIFFAMITLAVASALAVLVSQFSDLTGGEDGLTFKLPRELGPAFKFGQTLFDGTVFGVKLNGKLLTYYLVFGTSLVLFLITLRLVNAPFGRVLQAIRENEFRAEAIGYRVVHYKIAATCLSAAIASCAGALYAIWLRYVGPSTTLSLELMIDILLILVIGGMGTIYGAVIGATLFLLTENYLQAAMGRLTSGIGDIPVVSALLSPDRWLLWMGILFIVSVYCFPKGIVGHFRKDP
ncbi:branched-chain amino acid ABC transporter permease [Phaeobacter sp.]|uniref:branched-chain amino acid ABC transporter permease n=1 Tax=Phaeobacter sp. TaxID=1902409 RepID=UPI0025F4CF28|nr:branched-chain amino acid ABC transporter permease [Phaeobacter sp.]